jgi:hypothetical protein
VSLEPWEELALDIILALLIILSILGTGSLAGLPRKWWVLVEIVGYWTFKTVNKSLVVLKILRKNSS